jgi:K+-sensing histidine kinase KdpD
MLRQSYKDSTPPNAALTQDDQKSILTPQHEGSMLIELIEKINQKLLSEQLVSSLIDHELRSPLAGLSSTIEVLLQTEIHDRESLKNRLKRMSAFTDRMEFILDHLSDVEPLNHHSPQSPGFKKNVHQWIEKELNFYQSHHSFQHEIRIEVNSVITPIVFETDYDLMSLILHNMLDNAIKFSPPSSLIILRVEATQKSIEISCIDQGKGLGNDRPEDLMSAFARGSHTEEIPGTGLGLCIANRAAQQINGQLLLENNPREKGAKCSLRFDLFGQNRELGLSL